MQARMEARFRLLLQAGQKHLFSSICSDSLGTNLSNSLCETVAHSLCWSRTLDEHVEAIEKISVQQCSGVCGRQLVSSLVNADLLISDAGVIQVLVATQGTQTSCNRLSSVSIITCDDPHSLDRCANDVLAQFEREGQVCELVVIDDSRHGYCLQKNRQSLQALARERPYIIRYADRSRRLVYSRILSAVAGVEANLTEDLLLGPNVGTRTIGASRNCVLLQTVRSMTLSLDDDVLCSAGIRSPERSLSLARLGPYEVFRLFSSREEYEATCKFSNPDILAVNREYLGCHPSDIAAERGHSPIDVSYVDGYLAADLLRADAKIALTAFGSGGRSGTGDPTRLLGAESLARILETSSSALDNVLEGELSLRYSRSTALSSSVNMHGMCFGLDNRTVLPPFLPDVAGEDTLFGASLGLCCTGSFVCSIPLAVKHDPLPHRASSQQQLHTRRGHLGFSELVYFLFTEMTPLPSNSTLERFRYISKYLMDICLGNTPFFETSFSRIAKAQTVNRRERLLYLVRITSNPHPRWCAEINRAIYDMDVLLREDSHSWVPGGYMEHRGLEQVRELTRAAIVKLALSFAAWPNLWAAGAELQDRGECLAQQL